MSPQRRIYFGGTFNPVHLGHVRVAYEVCRQLCCAFYFVPCHIPPHKPLPQVSNEQRCAMLQCAVEELNEALEQEICAIEPFELQQAEVSFTVRTLEHLRKQYPQDQLNWLVGMDSLLNLHTWHRWSELCDHANLLVVDRPKYPMDLNPEVQAWLDQRRVNLNELGLSGGIGFIKTTPVAASSTQVREAAASGLGTAFLVPKSVSAYINQHKLYR